MAKVETAKQAEPSATKRTVRPRAPARSASLIRYNALVSAVDALLQSENPERVGLYQIAEKAGVPPASVYHFFPTKEAAFLALAHRHLEAFAQLSRQPIEVGAVASWKALTAWDLRRGVAYYNANPPAAKLFLGGFGGLEARRADQEYVEAAAQAAYERLNAIFHMPFLREPQKKFLIHLRIVDAVLSVSYVREGRVTDDYFDEALAAGVAYAKTFLPDHLELRPEIQAAVEQGQPIIVLPDVGEAVP